MPEKAESAAGTKVSCVILGDFVTRKSEAPGSRVERRPIAGIPMPLRMDLSFSQFSRMWDLHNVSLPGGVGDLPAPRPCGGPPNPHTAVAAPCHPLVALDFEHHLPEARHPKMAPAEGLSAGTGCRRRRGIEPIGRFPAASPGSMQRGRPKQLLGE
jgi:hypothetical protein